MSPGISLIEALKKTTLALKDEIDNPAIINYGDSLFKINSETLLNNNFVFVNEVKYNLGYSFRKLKTKKNINKKGYVFSGCFGISKLDDLNLILKKSHTLEDFMSSIMDSFKNIDSNTWFDIGNYSSYFKTKINFTSERVFNKLEITNGCVTKSSDNPNKILAEYLWYKELPSNLNIYVPRIIKYEYGDAFSYSSEYIAAPALSELYCYSDLQTNFWIAINNQVIKLMAEFCKYESKYNIDFSKNIQIKSNQRLNVFPEILKEKGIVVFEKLSSYNYIFKNTYSKTLIHGDLCYSNILFSHHLDRIFTLDPRGINFNGDISNFGSILYDIAKLSHSFYCGYDLIISEIIDSEEKLHEHYNKIQTKTLWKNFIENVYEIFGYSENEILLTLAHLFFSMIPLHSESHARQVLLLKNTEFILNKL